MNTTDTTHSLSVEVTSTTDSSFTTENVSDTTQEDSTTSTLTTTPETTTGPDDGENGGNLPVGAIAGISVALVFVVLVIIFIIVFLKKRKGKQGGRNKTTLPNIEELHEIEKSYRHGDQHNASTSVGYTNEACSSPEGRQRKISIQPKPITYTTEEPIGYIPNDEQLDVLVEPPSEPNRLEQEDYDVPKHHYDGDSDDDDPELYKTVPSHHSSVAIEESPSEEKPYQNFGNIKPRPIHAPPNIAQPNRNDRPNAHSNYANFPTNPAPHKTGKKKHKYVNVDDDGNAINGQNAYLQEVSPPTGGDDNPETDGHDYVNKEAFLQSDYQTNKNNNNQRESDTISNNSHDSHDYENNPIVNPLSLNKPIPPPKQKRHGQVTTPRTQENTNFGMEMMGDRTS